MEFQVIIIALDTASCHGFRLKCAIFSARRYEHFLIQLNLSKMVTEYHSHLSEAAGLPEPKKH